MITFFWYDTPTFKLKYEKVIQNFAETILANGMKFV